MEGAVRENNSEVVEKTVKDVLAPLRSVTNITSPSPSDSRIKQRGRTTPRSRMKRSQSVIATPNFDRAAEEQRWSDVISVRQAEDVTSPLRIYPNPLRLFEPARIQTLTGNKVAFDVLLEDPFLATPDRKQQRAALNRQSTQLAFSLGAEPKLNISAATLATASEFGPSSDDASVTSAPTTIAEKSRLPTPRLTVGEEAALLFANHDPVKKVKKGKRRVIKRLHSSTVPRAESSSDMEIEIPAGQRSPRWGSIHALVRWVVLRGDAADKAVLAMTYRAFWKCKTLIATIQSLFIADLTEGRLFRVGALQLVGHLLDALPFFSSDYTKDAHLALLEEFVSHTATMHSKMVAQRHMQAKCYAAAPALLARVREAREMVVRVSEERAVRDSRQFYRKTSADAHAVLRDDADTIAMLISAGVVDGVVTGPVVEGRFAWPKMEARKLAAAMTAIDSSMFSALTGRALLHGARSGPAAEANKLLNGRRVVVMNHIVTITSHWNNVSRWVPSAVLFYQKDKSVSETELAKGRAKLLRQFIDLASELRALENWSSFFAIVIGLGSSALTCLKETWKLVPSKQLSLMREMEEACQPIANFRIYRESVARCMESGTFCIPYLAIVLKDLQAVEEGNQNKNARGLYSFEKLQLFSAAMLKVRQVQEIECPIKSVDKKLLQFVLTVPCQSETELWDKSRIVKELEIAMAEEPVKRFPTFRR
jgi:hypothetical protein